jgi:hypothetical protein
MHICARLEAFTGVHIIYSFRALRPTIASKHCLFEGRSGGRVVSEGLYDADFYGFGRFGIQLTVGGFDWWNGLKM